MDAVDAALPFTLIRASVGRFSDFPIAAPLQRLVPEDRAHSQTSELSGGRVTWTRPMQAKKRSPLWGDGP